MISGSIGALAGLGGRNPGLGITCSVATATGEPGMRFLGINGRVAGLGGRTRSKGNTEELATALV